MCEVCEQLCEHDTCPNCDRYICWDVKEGEGDERVRPACALGKKQTICDLCLHKLKEDLF